MGNEVCRDIFKAVCGNKWMAIEYRNQAEQMTRYWIGVRAIDPVARTLKVTGLHLTKHTLQDFDRISIDHIKSSYVVEGSYFPVPPELQADVQNNPHRYEGLFGSVPNLRVLDYLEDCNKLDSVPYSDTYSLVKYFDGSMFVDGCFHLSDEQFKQVIKAFQRKSKGQDGHVGAGHLQRICLNVMSINTPKGLYVLAYRRLRFNVGERTLETDGDIVLCREFMVGEGKARQRLSVRRFLDDEDLSLLSDFNANAELIKDRITISSGGVTGVDDEPYIIALGVDRPVELEKEYAAIAGMYANNTVTVPLRAFFGELVKQPTRHREFPMALLDDRMNLDQLLAVNTAMKYPLAYIQGPPGTGKTTTIINTIVTAFFNERTVLFASYNNHPVDGVFDALCNIHLGDKTIPFPIVRLGNNEHISSALDHMLELYERVKDVPVLEPALAQSKDERKQQAALLGRMLARYEERLDLIERRSTVEKLLETSDNLSFQAELQAKQLADIDVRLAEIGETDLGAALQLVAHDSDNLLSYLGAASTRRIKRLGEPRYAELLDILKMARAEGLSPEDDPRVTRFNHYLAAPENLKNLLRVFPIVATTCISARRLGDPEPAFDMTIIDEASQCNTAISLIPILRGENLMLVGDPQQLNPVVQLDSADNATLRASYQIGDEYDYLKNSIYKTYLACDSVSDEILLSYHYRCDERIIDFNNRKYYSGKLNIKSGRHVPEALTYMEVASDTTDVKNAAPAEAAAIVDYVKSHSDRSIGVITPFRNQMTCIKEALGAENLGDVTCGTVHAFQGDEKDEMLFSLALTDMTTEHTYAWLADNRELINVATSRAKDHLVVFSNEKNIKRLHAAKGTTDDIFELVEYVKTNGTSKVTGRAGASRALGVKPYSTKTEAAFLQNLGAALGNIFLSDDKYVVRREVPISHVFGANIDKSYLFYSGSFDFVVYERTFDKRELPVLAIELDGKEHFSEETVKERDRQKEAICHDHGFELIRVENSYARRYNYIKDILIKYFEAR